MAPSSRSTGGYYDRKLFQLWLEPGLERARGGAERRPALSAAPHSTRFLERELRLAYNFTIRGDEPSADEQEGEFELELPISRRFLIEFEGGAVALRPDGQHWRTRGADLNVIPEIMLVQTPTLSFSSGFVVRTPTGGRAAEQGRTSVTPYLALWKDLGHRVGLHTFVGGEIPLGGFGANPPDAVLEYGVAPTVTVTGKEKPYLGDLTFFVELNGDANLRGADHGASTVTVLPGTRWMVLSGLWFATGYEIPVIATHQLSSRLLAKHLSGLLIRRLAK